MNTADESGDLPRQLSLLDSTMINVGSMIGSGIFIVPSAIALYLHSTSLVLLVWVVGGIVSLFGALSVAELGAMMPKAGGQYVYLREAYGPLWGFLYGWAAFTVIMTAAIAAIAVGFATYLGYFIPLDESGLKIVAIASIILLTAINCLGARAGAAAQNIFTMLKIGAFVLLVLLAFILTGGSTENFRPLLPKIPSFSTLIGPLGLAMVAVLWSYDGWIEITYVAGEVKDPDRNMHRSLIISTLLVVAIYIVINLVFVYVLSLDKMAGSPLVASDAATVLLGPTGATFITVAVIISTLGANNGFVFTGARIYYAMAREGFFFQRLGTVNRRFRTPVASLVSQGGWSCLLVLTGTFQQLFTYVIFASWIFYAMSCGAVIILRKRSPHHYRPYRTPGYPYTPILFILFAIGLVVNTIIESPRDAAIGAALIAAGIPAYYYWSGKRTSS
ncbi:MAG: amino acid permease-associated region [Bacteroidetes bacterium]|nr:amino acid permease-associated region [Bacteroidota bacterium]